MYHPTSCHLVFQVNAFKKRLVALKVAAKIKSFCNLQNKMIFDARASWLRRSGLIHAFHGSHIVSGFEFEILRAKLSA